MRVDYYPNELGEVSGSCLQGHQDASYDQLVKLFGEPNIRPGDKTWNEWGIQFEYGDAEDDDNEIARVAIYDWKEVSADDSRVGKYLWHIGAKTHFGVEMVYAAVGQEILDRPVADNSVDEKLFAVRQ